MARSTAVFVPNAVATSFRAADMEIGDVPKDIRDEIEEIYQGLLVAPSGRMQIQFDTVQELHEYVRFAQAYCALRPAGQIRFRKSPVKGKDERPDTVLDFKVMPLITKTEETTATVRAATVKAGGSDGTPKAVKAVVPAKPVVPAAKPVVFPAKKAAPAKFVSPAAMPAKRGRR